MVNNKSKRKNDRWTSLWRQPEYQQKKAFIGYEITFGRRPITYGIYQWRSLDRMKCLYRSVPMSKFEISDGNILVKFDGKSFAPVNKALEISGRISEKTSRHFWKLRFKFRIYFCTLKQPKCGVNTVHDGLAFLCAMRVKLIFAPGSDLHFRIPEQSIFDMHLQCRCFWMKHVPSWTKRYMREWNFPKPTSVNIIC